VPISTARKTTVRHRTSRAALPRAYPQHRSSNANSLQSQNSAGFAQICAIFQSDNLRRTFLSSSPSTPARQCGLCARGADDLPFHFVEAFVNGRDSSPTISRPSEAAISSSLLLIPGARGGAEKGRRDSSVTSYQWQRSINGTCRRETHRSPRGGPDTPRDSASSRSADARRADLGWLPRRPSESHIRIPAE
jgi:hypothetical protein